MAKRKNKTRKNKTARAGAKKNAVRKKSRVQKTNSRKRRGSKSHFLSSEELEQLLSSDLSESDRSRVVTTLGEETLREYETLLKQKEKARTARFFGQRGRVFLLPGILGSTIGTKSDLIWIDPLDLQKGKFTKLKLPDSGKYQSQGVIPFQYAILKLRLEISGYDVEYFHYDWRQSLDELGQAFSKRLKKEDDGVRIVAHSLSLIHI